jgi:hypothetical protein
MSMPIQAIEFHDLTPDNLGPEDITNRLAGVALHSFFPLLLEAQKRALSLKDRPGGPAGTGFSQLVYLRDYITTNPEFDVVDTAAEGGARHSCRSILLERHYIDRDFMEDFVGFHARNLDAPANSCSRIHFFSLTAARLQGEIQRLWNIQREERGSFKAREAVTHFCQKYYLGFSVVRPLSSAPVGRTVLRVLPRERIQGAEEYRTMSNTRQYTAHVMGMDFTVRGLAFQQQDICISACATVSIWCALHRAAHLDNLRLATPMEITHSASQYHLPLGRSMPAPGLDLDQMCVAIQSAGASPYLMHVNDAKRGRALIHAAVLSGLPVILILCKGTAHGEQNPETQEVKKDIRHAVTVVGMKIREAPVAPDGQAVERGFADEGDDMLGLYLHDDRIGPYRSASFVTKLDKLFVKIPLSSHRPREGVDADFEHWDVEHLLIPMWPKIRIGPSELLRCAHEILAVTAVKELRDDANSHAPMIDMNYLAENPLRVSYRIWPNHDYISDLNSFSALAVEEMHKFIGTVPLSRYVATISLGSKRRGWFDVLLDTTSTYSDPRWLGIVVRREIKGIPELFVIEQLQKKLQCPIFGYDPNAAVSV